MFDLEVVIIGGGIAGTSLGLFLEKEGYKTHLYERAEKILPVGAAISVWSNGVKVLNRLGLGKEARRLGGQMDFMTYRSSSDEPMMKEDLNPVYREVGERAYPIARGKLQRLLLDKYVEAGGRLTLGRSCVGVEKVDPNDPDSKVYAVFDDGSKSVECDLLVGADGIKSMVRAYVLEKEVPVVYHYTNWNGLVPMTKELGQSNEWIMYVGEGKRASLMPVGDGRFYFFMGAPLKEDAPAPEPKTEAMRDELKAIFKGWPEQVQKLLSAIDVTKLNRIPICDIDPLPDYFRGRVVLIGDAAHATTPTLGQGGCQALEDSEVLASFLTTTNVSVVDALQRYAEHRKNRVHTMVLKARERTATIYPQNEAQWVETDKWYQDLLTNPKVGENILNGIKHNLMQGPWPPRL